jgi:hypothetical protein
MMKKLFALTFCFQKQSYDDKLQLPRKTIISSSTCMDKHPIFGQIEENVSIFVQKSKKRAADSVWSLSLLV